MKLMQYHQEDFYNQYTDIMKIENNLSKDFGEVNDIGKRVFYLTLLHLVVLNPKGEYLS